MNSSSFKFLATFNLLFTLLNAYNSDIRKFDTTYSEEFNEINDKIIGGKFATTGQFPYEVLLRIIYPSKVTICGGSLISRKWILTAAHCVIYNGKLASKYKVFLGIIEKSQIRNAQAIHGDRPILHPNYDSMTLFNDIAVMRIYTANYDWYRNRLVTKPIALLPDSYHLKYDSATTVMGFGQTTVYAKFQSKELQYVQMKLISYRDCAKVFLINRGMICAENYYRIHTPCRGDSGSPLVYRDKRTSRIYQIGIVSFGKNICDGTTPEVFTNVRHYRKWINSVTGGDF